MSNQFAALCELRTHSVEPLGSNDVSPRYTKYSCIPWATDQLLSVQLHGGSKAPQLAVARPRAAQKVDGCAAHVPHKQLVYRGLTVYSPYDVD